MKKVTTLICILAIILVSCTGCGEVEKLDGRWTQVDPKATYLDAFISNDTISIYWVNDEDDVKSLYWEGTYTPPSKAGNYTWTSKGNQAEMASSLLASTAATKDISYKNGKISFNLTILGVDKTIELRRVK